MPICRVIRFRSAHVMYSLAYQDGDNNARPVFRYPEGLIVRVSTLGTYWAISRVIWMFLPAIR
jgi:hypothetical protein